ncbi:Histone-lysine N-methyltransferase SETMAR, partial [Harpegnathos saltator]
RCSSLWLAGNRGCSTNKTADIQQITTLIDSDRHITTRAIAVKSNIDQSTVSRHLNQIEMVKKFDVSVSQHLTERDLMDRISICDSLYRRSPTVFETNANGRREVDLFYNNIERKQ